MGGNVPSLGGSPCGRGRGCCTAIARKLSLRGSAPKTSSMVSVSEPPKVKVPSTKPMRTGRRTNGHWSNSCPAIRTPYTAGAVPRVTVIAASPVVPDAGPRKAWRPTPDESFYRLGRNVARVHRRLGKNPALDGGGGEARPWAPHSHSSLGAFAFPLLTKPSLSRQSLETHACGSPSTDTFVA